MQASAAKQARTMTASQDPPWHGMKGMTRITSEFKVYAIAGNIPSCCQESNNVFLNLVCLLSEARIVQQCNRCCGLITKRIL